jgi:alpha-1,3/alpha-1,6-mannosyltransferase
MACGLPVLACNTGGPTETVVDFADETEKPTGYLRAPDSEEWAPALAALIKLSPEEREAVSSSAKQRVRDRFSSETLGRELNAACQEAAAIVPHNSIGDKLITVGLSFIIFSLTALYLAIKIGGVGLPGVPNAGP